MAYVTVDELKASLGDEIDDAHDGELEAAADAATAAVNGHTGRVWSTDGLAAVARFFSPRGWNRRQVSIADCRQITQIREYGSGAYTTLTVGDDYRVSGHNVGPETTTVSGDGWIDGLVRSGRDCWSYEMGTGTVEVTGLWATTATPPDDIKRAVLILAARLFQRRSAPLGIGAVGLEGVAIRLSRIDPDVHTLLTPHRKLTVR